MPQVVPTRSCRGWENEVFSFNKIDASAAVVAPLVLLGSLLNQAGQCQNLGSWWWLVENCRDLRCSTHWDSHVINELRNSCQPTSRKWWERSWRLLHAYAYSVYSRYTCMHEKELSLVVSHSRSKWESFRCLLNWRFRAWDPGALLSVVHRGPFPQHAMNWFEATSSLETVLLQCFFPFYHEIETGI